MRAASGMRPKDICPPALVDMGTADDFECHLTPDVLRDAAAQHKLNLTFRR
jgi:hypothetical protein